MKEKRYAAGAGVCVCVCDCVCATAHETFFVACCFLPVDGHGFCDEESDTDQFSASLCGRVLGRFDDAIASYENALLEHKSKDTELKLKKAQKLKKKAAADAYINPELAQEHKEKGNVFFKAGKFPDAVKEYSEAIKRDPSNKFLYQNRATAYSKLMVFDAALQDCEKALKIDPNFVKAHARSGYCHKGERAAFPLSEAFSFLAT